MKQKCVDLFNEQSDTTSDDDMGFRDYMVSEYGEEYYSRLMSLPLTYRETAIQNFKNVYRRKKKLISF